MPQKGNVSDNRRFFVKYSFFFFLFLNITTFCSQNETPEDNKKISSALTEEVHLDKQSISIENQPFSYDVRAGLMTVSVKDTTETALSFIAYFKNDSEKRPIAFCFNGGPGSSSVWLHMGFLGPKIIPFENASFQSLPIAYKDNQETLLPSCDLVFIDAVSTGFSTNERKNGENSLYNVEDDLSAFADFIRLFLTKYNRWDSPKILVGESYGSLRAVGLAHLLQDQFFIDIHGLVLISLVLDLQTLDYQASLDIPCLTTLPTIAAIAKYHGTIGSEYKEIPIETVLEKTKQFAIHNYAPALIQGTTLPQESCTKLEKDLSSITSLCTDTLRLYNYRISGPVFIDNFLKNSGKIIGRFDGRDSTFRTPEEPSAGINLMGYPDPSFYRVSGLFSAGFHTYLLNDLHWSKESPYILINHAVQPWKWSVGSYPSAGLGYLSFLQDFRLAIAKNPELKTFVAAGIYDLATPFFAQQYSLTHTFLPQNLQKNVLFKEYEAGHMIYLDETARKKLHADIKNFIISMHS